MVERNVIKERLGFLDRAGSTPKWSEVLHHDPCVFCHSRTRITLDHITPVAQLYRQRGGSKRTLRSNTLTVANTAPACKTCNTAKADASLLGYLARRLPSQLRVVVTTKARQRAHRRLGVNPPREWWEQVGAMIKTGRVSIRSSEGGSTTFELDTNDEGTALAVRARVSKFRGHVFEVVITSVWLV